MDVNGIMKHYVLSVTKVQKIFDNYNSLNEKKWKKSDFADLAVSASPLLELKQYATPSE